MAQKPEHEGISNHTTRRHLLLRFRAGLGVLQQDPKARRILPQPPRLPPRRPRR